jgi:uncharacterized LabA/DUF88 family protein
VDRVAVFVDAGYLFAQGSAAIAGTKQPRTLITLNETAAIAELKKVANQKAGGVNLLRVYWYDGALGNRGLTSEQTRLAQLDDVKVRLGFVNNAGQQKGVDSLIVTDLIELARHGAITDAVMLTGDEDIRIGVQIAQTFGVRIHLIGIVPSRGTQSPQLLQEVDTTTEWGVATIANMLTIRSLAPPSPTPAAAVSSSPTPQPHSQSGGPANAQLDTVAGDLAASLDLDDIRDIQAFWATQNGVPPEFDGKLLARSRAEIGRDLDPSEKRYVRASFKNAINARIAQLP